MEQSRCTGCPDTSLCGVWWARDGEEWGIIGWVSCWAGSSRRRLFLQMAVSGKEIEISSAMEETV